MSQGIDIIGQGMDRAEVLEKVLCTLYDFIDNNDLTVNPEYPEDDANYIYDTIEQGRAYYEQG